MIRKQKKMGITKKVRQINKNTDRYREKEIDREREREEEDNQIDRQTERQNIYYFQKLKNRRQILIRKRGNIEKTDNSKEFE